ncbi:cobalamin biosynthesis protein CobG [Streptomyces sp. NPDC046237]|uniref:cobalamin biosynthesis protein CobG n=1 Tax=Streptomyces sp. NPDC046237 TaxID=3154914 RepID=UPI0033D38D45
MSPTPPTTPNRGEPLIRDRGDACPGALRLHPADDGGLARLRLPAGLLMLHQVDVLASAAESLGDGRVTVTSRGNVELRGLGGGCGAELADRLTEAGLLPSATHERVRNIVASPTAGLDGLGHADVQLWARELDALLCAEPWTAALSGRFLFALDDGRGDVAGLGGDVTLIAAGPWADDPRVTGGSPEPGATGTSAGGSQSAGETGASAGGSPARGETGTLVGGSQSAGETGASAASSPARGETRATAAMSPAAGGARASVGGLVGTVPRATDALLYVGGQAFRVAGADAPRAALAAADAFLRAARAAGNGAWRVKELPGAGGATGAEAIDAVGANELPGVRPADSPGAGAGTADAPGAGTGLLDLAAALARAGVDARAVVPAPPLPHGAPPAPGALGGRALHVLAPLGRLTAAQLRALLPADEVRLTPWRGAVVVGSPSTRLPELDAAGLITRPDDPRAGVGACTGRPGCAKSLADVRADAVPGAPGVPVHFSGCERRCGHPQGAPGTWVDVVATAEGTYLVDGRPTPRNSLTEAVATARTTR